MTITKWQALESKGAVFLNTLFPCAQFTESGGSNANESDIIVTDNSNTVLFRIEAKMLDAQAGQITIKDQNESFCLSTNSTNPDNSYTKYFIDYINSQYNYFSPVSTKSKALKLDETIIYSWIKEHYRKKGNSWILSINKGNSLSKNSLTLVPIENIEEYYTVSANLRIKKSGSSSISKTRRQEIKSILCSEYPSIDPNTDIIDENNKTYLIKYIGDGKINLPERYFIGEYKDGRYELRRRNGTENPNPNIMFNITLKKQCFQENSFRKFLKDHGQSC